MLRGRHILQSEQQKSVGLRLGKVVGTISNWTSVLFVSVTSVVSATFEIFDYEADFNSSFAFRPSILLPPAL